VTYVLSETAGRDLDAILQFIAERDGAARALTVLKKFERSFENLAESPRMGSLRKEITGANLRW
jgi:plasmid stabilization system protein ParE